MLRAGPRPARRPDRERRGWLPFRTLVRPAHADGDTKTRLDDSKRKQWEMQDKKTQLSRWREVVRNRALVAADWLAMQTQQTVSPWQWSYSKYVGIMYGPIPIGLLIVIALALAFVR